MKPIVLIVSRQFQAKHARKGQPTDFADKIRNALTLMNSKHQLTGSEPPATLKFHTIRDNYPEWVKRFEQIRSGECYLSVREWTGKPRQSGQTELFRLTKDNMIGLQRLDFVFDKAGKSYITMIDRKVISVDKIANNDGLSLKDWQEWFKTADLSQPMAVIQFTRFRY